MRHATMKTVRLALTAFVLFVTSALSGWSANVKESVEQVTTSVTLTDDVDYVITSTTPFGDAGIVNIANTEHAVLILEGVRSSVAIAKWLGDHVQVNGEKAVNNTNCQVKLYNLGCIILPYGNSCKPLTVYSEQNFGGEAVNDFGLEHSGGYMNTLTDAKLNNRIRSFKLKRGYMVTFANRASGRGYSRCFIAADQDLEMATLPGVLDQSISSYRVFKWYDTGKKQLANDLNTSTMAALNVQSSYTWSEGRDLAPDYECVPNHIYEDYPSSAKIGQSTWSPHSKNNNEPRNSSDDHPQDLTTILNNWENMMRTGMRLCSPASWDGSDYWNATGFLAEFLDSIDARGWRCDIIDLHCYWAEGSFGNIANWVNKYKRPVWISEWCWGASWNNNGAFASGVTENQVRDALQRICTNLNNWNYVERYYYWNGERDPSRLYKNGSLTPAGKYYAGMNSGLGYNGKYDFAPKVPTQYDPSNFSVSYDKDTHVATLAWHDSNGELNAGMSIQRREDASHQWVTLADVALKEQAADYTFDDTEALNGYQYRVRIVDANNKERFTSVVTAASSDLQAGDAVTIDGVTKYLGGNLFVNGDFRMDFHGWFNGKGEQLASPYFQVVPVGGIDNGIYLQTYGNGTRDSESAIKTAFALKPNTDYYFSGGGSNTGNMCIVALSEDGSSPNKILGRISNQKSVWTTSYFTFNSESYEQGLIAFYSLGAKTQLAQLLVAQLFDTQEEAIANGMELLRQKADAFAAYNTQYPSLTEELNTCLSAISGSDAQALSTATQAVDKAIDAYRKAPLLEQLKSRATRLLALGLYGHDLLESALAMVSDPTTAADFLDGYESLTMALNEYMPLTTADATVKSASLSTSTGWTTKCGTYTDGDQRLNSADGVTFWNAWWSGLSASEGTAKTMEIKQDITGLGHGLYVLECKASTEHYCLSDQHGYIASGEVTATTPALTADYYDLPTVGKEDRWQTLQSDPVYVDEGQGITIGFVGSKAGAVDNAWRRIGETGTNNGDKREGWWCATAFALKFHPLYQRQVVPGEYGALCLPYAVMPGESVRLYEIAGISSDFTKICLREIYQAAATVPFIYVSETSTAIFHESGLKSSGRTGYGPCGLHGFVNYTTMQVPVGYYVIINGEWQKAPDDRPKMDYFTAALRPFTNAQSNMEVLSEWAGATMPIHGVSDEEMVALGIADATMLTVPSVTTAIYTLDGRRVNADQLGRGIYIKVENGQPHKIIIK